MRKLIVFTAVLASALLGSVAMAADSDIQSLTADSETGYVGWHLYQGSGDYNLKGLWRVEPGGEVTISNNAFPVRPINFGTDGTTRMTITGTGNVGIGTSSPASKLHVNGGRVLISSGVGPTLEVLNPWVGSGENYSEGASIRFGFANHAATRIAAYKDASYAQSGLKFYTEYPTYDIPKLAVTITPSGDVGIGTDQPVAELDVVGDIVADDVTVIVNGVPISVAGLVATIGGLQTQIDDLNDVIDDLPAGLTKIDRNGDGD